MGTEGAMDALMETPAPAPMVNSMRAAMEGRHVVPSEGARPIMVRGPTATVDPDGRSRPVPCAGQTDPSLIEARSRSRSSALGP